MKYRQSLRIAAALCLAAFASSAWSYHISGEVRLPGTERWDYLSVDEKAGRLYVSHGTHVEVIDMKSLKAIGQIDQTPGVHGIAIADDLGRGYISAGASDSVVVFNLKTLARVAEVKTTGANPDAILYEPTTHRVFTFNGRGRNATAIDAKTYEVLGTIALDAKPEFAVADAAGQIFVNLEDTNSIAQIDARTLQVRARWLLKGCEEPSGLALDRENARLFSVCSNQVMEIVDAHSGRIVAQEPIGKNVDAAGFDPARHLAFASGGDATLTVVKEDGPDRFTVAETVTTRRGARTMAVSTSTHQVFLSAGVPQPAPPPVAGQPRTPPAIEEGSFEVVVLSP
jgi:DNA-binding beta-propeller fold protein YncE